MTDRDRTHLQLLNQILAGQFTAAEVAEGLALSVRQVRRLLTHYREDGAAALVHGNRGRIPIRTVATASR